VFCYASEYNLAEVAAFTCYASAHTLADPARLHLVQAALEKEIKDTLASWQQLLARADRIFVQASVSNARPIYGGDDAALQRHDPRIRSIPFNTRSALPEWNRLQAIYITAMSMYIPGTYLSLLI